MNRLIQLLAAVCWLTTGANPGFAWSADVEVKLTDGRTLRGAVVAEQTNREQLVVELRSAGLKLRRTLTWNQIADARVITSTKPTESRLQELPEAAPPEQTPVHAEPLPLSQLLVKADPISTTGKLDWDSLRLTLRGVDEHGEKVPVFGTLKATLWGQRRISPESNVVRHPFVTDANSGSRFLSAPSNSVAYQHPYVMSPNPTVELASWTRSLGAESQGGTRDSAVDERIRLANTWGSTGAWQEARVGSRQDGRRANSREVEGNDLVFVLPLQRPLPDHDIWTGTFGEVTVELLMPGVGVFEASAPDVVLSRQSLLRRERLYRDGSRFFPNEITTDSPQTTRSRNRFTWPGGVSGPERGILPIQP